MMDFDTYERAMWAGRAPVYERGFARLTAHTVDPLLDAARVEAGTRTLDLGTGPGIVAAEAARRGARVTAVDADSQMAETAARNAPAADVRVAVLPDLPFEDGTYDAVVGNFVINHVSDPAVTLRELHRVLRPGGRLALTCWVMPRSGVLALVQDAMEQVGVRWPDNVPPTPFTEYGRRDAFEGLLGRRFRDASAEELDWDHTFDPEHWWRTCAMARVGSSGVVLAMQDAATLVLIKDAYDRIVAAHAAGDGQVVMPAHALLARGVR